MYFRQLPNKDVPDNLIVIQLSDDEGDSSDSIKLLLERDPRLVELLRSTKSGELRFSRPEVDKSVKEHNNFTPFTLKGTLLLDSEEFTVSVPDLYFKYFARTRQCMEYAPWFTQSWGSEKYGEYFLLKLKFKLGYYLLELGNA